MRVEIWDQQANVHKFNQFSTHPSEDLVIIEIDDESIDYFNTWPWPRSRFAEFLYKVEQASPKLVAFDVDFSSKSNRADDQNFSNALKNVSFPVVLAATSRFSNSLLSLQSPKNKESSPIESFAKYSLLANVDVVLDGSGLVLKYPTYGKNNRPTMGALLANNPNTPNLPIQIDFSISPSSIPSISFKDILTDSFKFEQIRGKTLLIGPTSLELSDMYTLPNHGRLPSLIVHALGYESLVADDLFTSISPLLMLFWAITLFISLSFSLDDKRLTLALGVNLVVAAVVYAFSTLLHHFAHVMLPVTMLYVAILVSSVLQIFQNMKYRTYILFKETNRNNYNKALVNQVIRESSTGIIITNLSGGILVANYKAMQIFSIQQDAVTNNECVFDYVPGGKDLFTKVSDQRTQQPAKVEFVTEKFTNKSGSDLTIEIMLNKTSFVQYFDNHKIVFGGNKPKNHQIFNFAFNDVTEKMKIIAEKNRSEHQLIDLKNNDPLTKLPNRTSFNRVLELLYSNTHIGKTSMVVLINLDSIKEINELYGRDVGDDALYHVGSMLRQQVGKSGVVTRFSDKIFGIIYNDINTNNKTHYKKLVRDLFHLFAKPISLHTHTVPMAVSMGVVMAPIHGETPETLMINATQALDYSKASDSLDWFIYEEDLAQKIRSKREVRSELQRAIKNKEFVLYYQPQHEINGHKLIGYESLIRWEDPYKGLRFPNDFIHIAEEFGLITEIGELVLEIACHEAVKWPVHLSVAVNVSPLQFKNSDIKQLCLKYLKQSGLAAHRLELEITESTMMDDVDNVVKTLKDIQELNIKIAMDDFGTGYSSLQYLTELPFDKIKIDRSFTMNIGKSKQADALISTIVAFGHSLDKLVLAEGVETEEMIYMLKAAGCQYGQGYHYGKPMPASQVLEQLSQIELNSKSA